MVEVPGVLAMVSMLVVIGGGYMSDATTEAFRSYGDLLGRY